MADSPLLVLDDDFEQPPAMGQRRVIDREGVVGADNKALRIRPLLRPGWGRSGLSYGPLPAHEEGFSFAICLLNGHHMSRTYKLRSPLRQLARWAVGGAGEPLLPRLLAWATHRQREPLLRRKLRAWLRHREGARGWIDLRDNLAVGLFSTEAPIDPRSQGACLLVRSSATLHNGELRCCGEGFDLLAIDGLQNTPLTICGAVRNGLLLLFAASLPGAHGLRDSPALRPIGAVPAPRGPAHLGAHQAVLGEIGFFHDTRVYSVRAGVFDEDWTGAATIAPGERRRGPVPGLLRLTLPLEALEQSVSLRWGGEDDQLALHAERDRLALVRHEGGRSTTLASHPLPTRAGELEIQLLDDGCEAPCAVDGSSVFAGPVAVERSDEKGACLIELDAPAEARCLVVPRAVQPPQELAVEAPAVRAAGEVVAADDFAGPAGDLEGRTTPTGALQWRRRWGRGVFELTGSGQLRVRASVAAPCPGRTIYALPWRHAGGVEASVVVTPPGTARGQQERCRAGFAFIQDQRDMLLVNVWLDDRYTTTSISTFYRFDGFEDIFDAVWSCMGERRVVWGEPFELRVRFDEERFLACVDGEPILVRAISDVQPWRRRLPVREVGLLANWEWGCDTGSRFERLALAPLADR